MYSRNPCALYLCIINIDYVVHHTYTCVRHIYSIVKMPKNTSLSEEVPCNLCGESDTTPFFTLKGFNLVKCRRCRLIYVNPRPAPQALYGMYDEGYFVHRDNCYTGEYFGYYDYIGNKDKIKRSFVQRLKTIENFRSPGKLLDVGCAAGYFLSSARERGWQASGLDISAFAVGLARKELGEGSVKLSTLLEAGYPAESFDAVTLWDVLEHLPDPSANLKEAWRILKPGGILGLVIPNAGSPAAIILGRWWPEFRRIKEHIYFFTKPTILNMLKKAGFDLMLMESAGRIFSITELLSECKIFNYRVFERLASVSDKIGFSGINFYVKPGYKISIYAKKIPT